jgi:hypothetical protein
VGLATPVGLGLVAAGVLAGAIGVGIKTLISEAEKSKRHGKLADTSEDEAEQVAENEPWLLLEWLPYSADPTQTYFETEHQASDAYNMSPILEKVLLGPDRVSRVQCSGLYAQHSRTMHKTRWTDLWSTTPLVNEGRVVQYYVNSFFLSLSFSLSRLSQVFFHHGKPETTPLSILC